MSIFDEYRAKMSKIGVGSSDRKENRIRRTLAKGFDGTVGSSEVNVITPNGDLTVKNIQLVKGDFEKERITLKPEQIIEPGSVILDFQGFDWLVMKERSSNNILQTAEIEQINYELQWLDSEGNQYTSYSVVEDGSIKVDGLDESKYLTLPEGSIILSLQSNDINKKIVKKQRLMVDKTPYEVRKISKFEKPGVLILLLIETQRSDLDSEDICDFYKDYEPTPVNPPIRIEGKNTIVAGFSRPYQVYEYDYPITAAVLWSIDNSDFELTVEDGVATVLAPSDYNKIGTTANLTAKYLGVTRTIEITCVSLV